MSAVLEDTRRWFTKAVPTPTERNVRVQFGVHLEEVLEMLNEVAVGDHTTMVLLDATRKNLADLSKRLKTEPGLVLAFPDRVATLDAICDQLVTATGFAYMMKMDPIGGLNSVNESNWSKFVDGEPQFDENGKIQKGPNYHKPDLQSFV